MFYKVIFCLLIIQFSNEEYALCMDGDDLEESEVSTKTAITPRKSTERAAETSKTKDESAALYERYCQHDLTTYGLLSMYPYLAETDGKKQTLIKNKLRRRYLKHFYTFAEDGAAGSQSVLLTFPPIMSPEQNRDV